jgi:recombination protein RecT
MANNTQVAAQKVTVSSLTQNPAVAKRFSDILGKKSAGFISSLVSLSKTKALAVADANTVVASSLIAASLDLPIVPTLGFAAIVPFYDSKTKCTIAQFQIMTKGLIQLAQRSGQYKTINVTSVYDGDIKGYNRFTGEIEFNNSNVPDQNAEPIGYVAYMQLTNGFEKYLYMTSEELKAHGLRFSQTFKKGFGLWKDNFEAMAKKTVLKLLLSKYGPLSVDTQMQLAMQADQAAIRMESIEDTAIADATLEYVDNSEGVSDATVVEETPDAKKERVRKSNAENPELP